MVAFFQKRGGEASTGAVAVRVEGIERDSAREEVEISQTW